MFNQSGLVWVSLIFYIGYIYIAGAYILLYTPMSLALYYISGIYRKEEKRFRTFMKISLKGVLISGLAQTAAFTILFIVSQVGGYFESYVLKNYGFFSMISSEFKPDPAGVSANITAFWVTVAISVIATFVSLNIFLFRKMEANIRKKILYTIPISILCGSLMFIIALTVSFVGI